MITKLAVAITAFMLGISVILIFTFIVIPNIIMTAQKSLKRISPWSSTIKQWYSPPSSIYPTRLSLPFEQPIEESGPAFRFPRDCFANVLTENEDIVGRITLDALDINYLVTQATDNEYYLQMGYDRKNNSSGAIFLDYRCNIELDPLRATIYSTVII